MSTLLTTLLLAPVLDPENTGTAEEETSSSPLVQWVLDSYAESPMVTVVVGLVALSGMVVNASLVLVDFVNRRRQAGVELATALGEAGVARFRPILLTSLTTFAGLTPLMLESSMQARFMIPMAISIAFGVVFASLITLFLVPASYLVLEDLARWRRREPAARSKPARKREGVPGVAAR